MALFPVRPPPAVLTAVVVARKGGPRGRRSARAVRGDGSDDGVEGERALDALDALCEAGGGDPEGANLTRRSMHDALRANGVERCEPAVGDKFDVSMMEAVFTVPVAEGQATGNVEEVFRPGYLLHERVLRAAQVGVGAPPPAPPTDTTTD